MKRTAEPDLEAPHPSNRTWNLSELLECLDHDHAFLCELLTVFRQDGLTTLREAKEALSCRELPVLNRKAHTLKGMLRNLLMERAGHIASELELAAGQGQLEACIVLLARLETELQELWPEVEAQLAEVKT